MRAGTGPSRPFSPVEFRQALRRVRIGRQEGLGNGWLDDVAAPARHRALAIPFVIGTFCLSVLEAYERAAFDPVGVAYQAALTAALLFVTTVILWHLVRTRLCWALVITAISVAPLLGSVRTLQGDGIGIDAFTPNLTTVLVVGIGASLLAAGGRFDPLFATFRGQDLGSEATPPNSRQ